MINEFRGKYYFLSNFYEASVTWDGITYKNNEAAFQSAKVLDKSIREKFSMLDPSSAKRKGRVAPSILQKRQATLRVINQLNKWINITDYWLDNVG